MRLVFLSLLFASSFGYAQFKCQERSAQFFGTIQDVKIIPLDQGFVECTYRIQIQSFNENPQCPLDIAEAQSVEFLATPCDVKKNDSISGTFIETNGQYRIE